MIHDFMRFAAMEAAPITYDGSRGVILIAVLIILLGGVVCAIMFVIQIVKRKNGNSFQGDMIESKCPDCGETLIPGKKFCIKCGNKISVEEEA